MVKAPTGTDAETEDLTALAPWLERWGLTADGAAIVTPSSKLLPVRRAGEPAMLKAAMHPEETLGQRLLGWWDGAGAVRLLEAEDDAVLLERAIGERSLADMARSDRDDEAMAILCDTAGRLHAARPQPPPTTLVPLERWFRELQPGAAKHGGVLQKSLAVSRTLLAQQQEVRPLHGDIHHDNVLDGGARGWLAIDPKGVLGDRGYDYANMICNPWGASFLEPARIDHRVDLVAERSGLGRTRLLRWLLAYAGLSAAWTLYGDWEGDARPALRIAEIAAGLLESA